MIDRQAWLEARRKGIGGTDAAGIVGVSKYRTAVDVWQDKLGIAPEVAVSPAMEWGLRLEDAIAHAYQVERPGRRVRRVAMRKRVRGFPDGVEPFPMFGSLDRIAYPAESEGGRPRVLELKTARSGDDFAPADGWRDVEPHLRVPPAHYVQVQHYLEVVDLDDADVAVLVGGSDFRIIPIPRDRDYGRDLLAEESTFWHRYVVPEIQPPVTAEDLDYLARKYPVSDGDERVATAEQTLLVDEYLSAGGSIFALESRRDEIRAELEDAMGTTPRLIAPGATVRWKSYETTTTAWKELAGVYRRKLEELIHDEYSGTSLLGGLLQDLDTIEGLYQRVETRRPFVVDRKKGGR